MKLKYFIKKIVDVKVSDYLAILPMVCALVISPFYKKQYSKTWLVCESDNEARDNGYHFFKYLREKQPQQDCYYAIAKNCPDEMKIKSIGKSVSYGGLKHWILYYTSQYNISSQKGGKPNSALCSFFELNGLFKPHNVFLQHGITKDKNDWLMADKCRFDFFVTGMASENEFVKKAFGYDPEIIHYTGFPRFDNLHDNSVINNRIIIMPTWRKWLKSRSEKNSFLGDDIASSDFLKKWVEFLNSPELDSLIDKYNLEVVFYPHRAMQPYIELFNCINEKIRIASVNEYDMQELMKSAQLMITDYSSVYFDMFYMKKPVIFYQFDEDVFRKYHYEEGWFDYHSNPFGKSFASYREVLEELERYISNGYKVSDGFLEAHHNEFQLYDDKNSERIYSDLIAR